MTLTMKTMKMKRWQMFDRRGYVNAWKPPSLVVPAPKGTFYVLNSFNCYVVFKGVLMKKNDFHNTTIYIPNQTPFTNTKQKRTKKMDKKGKKGW